MHLTVTSKLNDITPITATFSSTHIRDTDKSTLHLHRVPKQTGGATVIGVSIDGGISMHHAKCDPRDGFSRRLGTLMCLDRFVDQTLRSQNPSKAWSIVSYRCDANGYYLIVESRPRPEYPTNGSVREKEAFRVLETRRAWERVTALASSFKSGKWVEYTTMPKEDTDDVVYTKKAKRVYQKTNAS